MSCMPTPVLNQECGSINAKVLVALNLTLKKKWFDMIESGEKKEEYREPKDYWKTRLLHYTYGSDTPYLTKEMIMHYDIVIARNGYSASAPKLMWINEGLKLHKPNPKWCEPSDADKVLFALQIGKVTRL